ncbi:Ubiquitin carboxyl-terminal hydrolase 2, partial [Termitomyces sp. T112]
MTPEQAQEEESVVMLAGMMRVDNDQARRVLRKYKGNVEKAVDAMLSGDQGDVSPNLWSPMESSQDPSYVDPFTEATHTVAQSSSSNVIDLTGDDNDRTLKLSQAQSDVKFGPSERVPDPSWQLVTTNAQADTSHDDRAMNEAIQASLADFGSSEELEILPADESVREGGRPIALRTDASEIAYAALIIQAFAQIPQIRRNIATLLEAVNG